MKKLTISILGLITIVSISQAQNIETESALVDAARYFNGYLRPHDPKKAFSIYLQIAQTGNAKAMNAVAIQYRLGQGVTQDYQQAFSWFTKAVDNGYTPAVYNLALMYKYGIGCKKDYEKAYSLFANAASKNYGSALYGMGYMLYKGLGVKQDYVKAVEVFKRGIQYSAQPACMYYLGICFRNGYGVKKNTDSAYNWLNKAAAMGYTFASDELASSEPENNSTAVKLLESIQTAKQLSLLQRNKINNYNKIDPKIDGAHLEGVYSGYLLRYDWSGKSIISTSIVNLALTYTNNKINGLWIENDSVSVQLDASLVRNTVTFKNTTYLKNDHYSKILPITFDFQSANLHLITLKDSVFLEGNLSMYSPDRGEPEKPLYIVLARSGKSSDQTTPHLSFQDNTKDNSTLTVFPNPFTSQLNIEFDLPKECEVYTQIFTIDGKMLYSNRAGRLGKGSYVLPIRVMLPAGTYVVKLVYENHLKTAVVVKQ
jgi:hypothetical protein